MESVVRRPADGSPEPTSGVSTINRQLVGAAGTVFTVEFVFPRTPSLVPGSTHISERVFPEISKASSVLKLNRIN